MALIVLEEDSYNAYAYGIDRRVVAHMDRNSGVGLEGSI